METQELINALDYIIALYEDPDNPPAYSPVGNQLLQVFKHCGITDPEMLATVLMTALTPPETCTADPTQEV